MNSLMAKAERLIASAQNVYEAEQRTKRTKEYEARLDDLERIRKEYEILQAHVDLVVSECEIDRAELTEGVLEGVATALKTFMARFRGKTSVLIEGNDYGGLKRNLEQVQGEVSRRLSNSWEKWIEREAPPLQMDALELTLASENLAQEIRILSRQIDTYRRRIPRTLDEFHQVRQRVQELNRARQDAWNAVFGEGEELPDGTREFILAANTAEGASLMHLSPEILVWLERRGLLERFRVRNN